MGGHTKDFKTRMETIRWLNKRQAKRRLETLLLKTGGTILELKKVLHQIRVNS